MKTVKILTCVLILFSSGYVFAGDVQGTIEPIIQGRLVIITCDGKEYEISTDDRGGYEVHIPNPGNCEITVEHDDDTTDPFSFRVSNRLKRLDFTVIGERGRYELRRN